MSSLYFVSLVYAARDAAIMNSQHTPYKASGDISIGQDSEGRSLRRCVRLQRINSSNENLLQQRIFGAAIRRRRATYIFLISAETKSNMQMTSNGAL